MELLLDSFSTIYAMRMYHTPHHQLQPKRRKTKTIYLHHFFYPLFWFIGLLIFMYRMLLFAFATKQENIFNQNTLSDKKHIAYISDFVSLDKINAKRKSLKLKNVKKYATFNDFMLALIAESVTLYLQKKNAFISKSVYLATPVNIRGKNTSLVGDKGMLLGNKIGTYVLQIPLCANMTFVQRLAAIKSEFDVAKSTPEAIVGYYLMKLLSKVPRVTHFIGPRMTSGLTFVMSNVRGANNQTFCGAKIADIVGIVPPPMGVALGYAVFTYDGKVMISVNVDRNCYDSQTATELISCLKELLKK
eukprot:635364_1